MEHVDIQNGQNRQMDFLKLILECKEQNIPFFYISSNFGPYNTQEYFDLVKEVFSNSTDMCFRETYSYNLFKDVATVRYAPDVGFNYKPKQVEKIKDSVGISVIGLEQKPNLSQCEGDYQEFLKTNIIELVKQNKQIFLFPYCEYEGDMDGVKKLINSIEEKYRNSVKVVHYSNSIEEYIDLYQSMEYAICTRFHAMILSSVFGHKFFTISYSDKMLNVINDLQLTKDYIDIKDINPTTILSESDFSKIDDVLLNKIVGQAKGQFKALDDFVLKG